MKVFSYDPSKDQTFRAFSKELEKESDRGIAIICHAYIEELLKEILKKRLLADQDFHKSLENRISFHHVLSFCFLSGILTKTEKKEIECLSEIRNLFAHGKRIKSFENSSVRDKCGNLRILKPDTKEISARKKYISTAAYYVQILNLKLKYVKKIKEIEFESRGPKMLESLYI